MYRKFTADHIFTGHEMLPEPTVLVTDEFGTVIELIASADAGGEVEVFEGLLTPGFINAHCHLELSHLKGVIPQKTGLVNFVQQVMTGRGSTDEAKMAAMANAEAEMFNAGIVAVGDICNTADSITIKQTSKLQWHNFIEVSGFIDGAAPKRLDDMKKVAALFHEKGSRSKTTLSPHAPYSVSKTLFHLLNAETNGQLITIHNQECAAENELYLKKDGLFLDLYKNFGIDISSFEATQKSSFQSWLPYFKEHQSIISVHNTFTTKEDVDFLAGHLQSTGDSFFYCLCPNANKYIEQKVPPIDLLKNPFNNIIIGTDSYASNTSLNILAEIKTIQQETGNAIPLATMLQWATLNGARALQVENTAGSFDKGKTPGIVLIAGLDNLHTTRESFARRIL